MHRKEILERNKKSNPEDEGVKYIKDNAEKYGFQTMNFLFIFLAIYNFEKKVPQFDIAGLFLASLGVQLIYTYNKSKKKGDMITGIVSIIISVICFVTHVIQTW